MPSVVGKDLLKEIPDHLIAPNGVWDVMCEVEREISTIKGLLPYVINNAIRSEAPNQEGGKK